MNEHDPYITAVRQTVAKMNGFKKIKLLDTIFQEADDKTIQALCKVICATF